MPGHKRAEAHFLLMPPPSSAGPVLLRLCFWRNPTVCAAQTDGLLKQPNQVELSYCKCSPSGVSHFQGPHEHMRHSCETGRRKEGGGYMKQLQTSSHCKLNNQRTKTQCLTTKRNVLPGTKIMKKDGDKNSRGLLLDLSNNK